MNEASCAEVEELLAAYALSAISQEEACGLATHLAECRRHDAELQAYRSTVGRLADLSPEVLPPAPLRDKLLQSFDGEMARQEPEQRPPSSRATRLSHLPTFAYGLAAALLVLAV